MKFALYGMPCAGKTTLLNAISTKLKVINGSSWLNEHKMNKKSGVLNIQNIYQISVMNI